MVGCFKNAPKDDEWLLKEIRRLLAITCLTGNEPEIEDQILDKMKEGGWVSPVEHKEALSRELAAGYRLAVCEKKDMDKAGKAESK